MKYQFDLLRHAGIDDLYIYIVWQFIPGSVTGRIFKCLFQRG